MSLKAYKNRLELKYSFSSWWIITIHPEPPSTPESVTTLGARAQVGGED